MAIGGSGSLTTHHPAALLQAKRHCDLSGICELWDGPRVAKIQWGLRNPQRTEFGRITLNNGASRNFWNRDLLLPYIRVHKRRWAERQAASAGLPRGRPTMPRPAPWRLSRRSRKVTREADGSTGPVAFAPPKPTRCHCRCCHCEAARHVVAKERDGGRVARYGRP